MKTRLLVLGLYKLCNCTLSSKHTWETNPALVLGSSGNKIWKGLERLKNLSSINCKAEFVQQRPLVPKETRPTEVWWAMGSCTVEVQCHWNSVKDKSPPVQAAVMCPCSHSWHAYNGFWKYVYGWQIYYSIQSKTQYKDWPKSAQLKMKRDISRIPKKSTRCLGNNSKSYIPKHENTKIRQGKYSNEFKLWFKDKYYRIDENFKMNGQGGWM